MSGWIKKIKDFLAETRLEMRKVSFPSRDEVVATTVVVLITSTVFAVFLWISDIVIQRGYIAIVKAFER
jgi:preprotein translocase subunit SecE